MDFSKIRLNNERNQHVTKRLNRLNTWNFFKVLYRDNFLRLFGFSILMLLCVAPIVVVIWWGRAKNIELSAQLPFLNGFGFSSGVWEGLDNYYAAMTERNNMYTGLLAVAASLLCSLVFSGGFAVIRDAFWTGKLSTVGVLKSIGKGVKASFLYALVTNVVLAFSVFGAYEFYVWASAAMPLWLAIVLLVLICIVIMFVAIYLCIVCSVATTYKQSVYETLDDAWRLMWLNILPNIIHFLLALIPIALVFAGGSSALSTLIMVFVFMFGGMYVPLVWQTHMMRTFALFHPVEVKKKKAQHVKAEEITEDEPAEQPQTERKGKKSRKDNAEPEQEQAPEQDQQPAPEASEVEIDADGSGDDVYATEDEDYKTDTDVTDEQ